MRARRDTESSGRRATYRGRPDVKVMDRPLSRQLVPRFDWARSTLLGHAVSEVERPLRRASLALDFGAAHYGGLPGAVICGRPTTRHKPDMT